MIYYTNENFNLYPYMDIDIIKNLLLIILFLFERMIYMSQSTIVKVHKCLKHFDIGGIKSIPMFVSSSNDIRIGAISFDPICFIGESDGTAYSNIYEQYIEKIGPTIAKLQHKLRSSHKKKRSQDIKYIHYQLELEKKCRNDYKNNLFYQIISSLWSKYDVLITESLESLMTTVTRNSIRGQSYPGQNILSKPYFSEFLIALQFSTFGNNGISKLLLPVSPDIVRYAHNTCHKCGFVYPSVSYTPQCQWICTKCNTYHIEGVNTAINLRNTYFDVIMRENNTTYLKK